MHVLMLVAVLAVRRDTERSNAPLRMEPVARGVVPATAPGEPWAFEGTLRATLTPEESHIEQTHRGRGATWGLGALEREDVGN